MITISLCMIVKNEQDVIARCLDSVAGLFDEIIIVDTGSTDATKEIIAHYTDKVYDFEWVDDFSAARNFSFEKAKSDFCIWLDADDVILKSDYKMLAELKAEMTTATDVIMMKYNTGFDEKGNVTFSYYRERIVKNIPSFHWIGAIHEVIESTGVVEYSDCAITHQKLHPSDPDRNLRIFEKMIENGLSLDPRQKFYYGRELFYHQRFEDATAVFEGFLDEGKGWIENKIDACRHCAYCYYGRRQQDKALLAFLRSFAYDVPRAEVCCEIGRHFFDREQYSQAAFWYKRALECNRADDRGGFVSPEAYGYTPCLQLCVCMSRMGEIAEAVAYNEKAGAYKPDSEAVAHNRAYFIKLNALKQDT